MFLQQVAKEKREYVRQLKAKQPVNALKRTAAEIAKRDFSGIFSKRFTDRVNIIAEVKKASPSKGAIAPDADPRAVAAVYERGGAAAVSVLTETKYFSGSIEFLPAVRSAVEIPVLRKDFIVDEYEIYEAKARGADAVLLIGEILERDQISEYLHIAEEIGIDVLLEVHSLRNYDKIADLTGYTLGINNRDLETLKIDLAISEDLIPRLPPGTPVIVESGIETRSDIERYMKLGVSGFLIGSALMISGDPAAKLRELRGA